MWSPNVRSDSSGWVRIWAVPPGLGVFLQLSPALKRWAKLVRPFGAGSLSWFAPPGLDHGFTLLLAGRLGQLLLGLFCELIFSARLP
jgi:hypothetical protein